MSGLQPGDEARIEAVAAALGRIRDLEAAPLGLGLDPAHAQLCLDLALDQLSEEGLRQELSTRGERPEDLVIVASHGVFTAVLEWLTLFAAAGIRVRLKSSTRGPEPGAAFAQAFAAEGLDVSHTTSRILGRPEVIVAFGGDDSLATLRAAHPRSRVVGYGHRTSLAVVNGPLRPHELQALAADLCLYDTRGCMAPAAVLALRDAEALAAALFEELGRWELRMPLGFVDPLLGPERRRRLGLARVLGRTWETPQHAVALLPQAHLPREALPRVATVVPVEDLRLLVDQLCTDRSRNSSLAIDDPTLPVGSYDWDAIFRAFPRVCALGHLQLPAFPRLHDGRPMLGSVLRPGSSGAAGGRS